MISHEDIYIAGHFYISSLMRLIT